MGESRLQKGIRNAAFSVAAQVINLLLAFISRKLFVQFLSVEYLGLNSLFSNVLTMLSLAELGIGEAIGYALYRPIKENDQRKLHTYVNFYRRAYLVIAAVIGILGFILSFFLDHLYIEKPDLPENFRVIFLMFVANSVCSYIMGYKQTILVAGQREYIASVLRQVVHAIQSVAQIAVLAVYRNYYVYIFLQICATLVYNLIISNVVDRSYPFLNQKPHPKLEKAEKDRISRDVAALSVSKIAGVVMNGTDSILISKIIGVSTAGVASNYSMVIGSVNGIVWKALISIKPSLGNYNVDASIERKRALYDELFLVTFWIYCVVSVCLLVLLSPFVALWMGREYLVDQSVVFALILSFYVGGVNYPTYAFRTTHGRFEEVKWSYVASGMLNIVLSIILGIRWDVFGIFLATAISRICTSEIIEGRVLCEKILERKLLLYFVRHIGAFAVVVTNYLITKWSVSMIPDGGLSSFVLKATICFAVSNGFLLILLWRTKAFKAFFCRIKMLGKQKLRLDPKE